jgi:hypothetical protein
MRVIGTNSEVLRRFVYDYRPVEENTGTGDKIALSGNQIVKSDQLALSPLRPSLTKQDSCDPFLDKKIVPKSTFSIEKTTFRLDIDTQLVQDQYTIDKVALDATGGRAINKYREAQAYRFQNTSTLEVYA